MKFKLLGAFTIFLLIFFTGCDSKDTTEKVEVKKEETPTFVLKTDLGKTITLEATKEGMIFKGYENKVILLNFFATWCPPCKAEIPHLNNLRERFNGKFEVIAVLLEENKSAEEILGFIKEFDVQYPITNSAENFVLAEAVGGVKSIPTMFLFGTNGDVVEKYVGMVPEEMLASDIEKALSK